MVRHLFSRFLVDSSEYRGAVQHWEDLWRKIDVRARTRGAWRSPWLSTKAVDGTDFADGNPIFSAYSPDQKKAIRVIQFPPTTDRLQLDYWLDSFGGEVGGPQTTTELVISCALSDSASALAFSLMSAWVKGEIEIEFSHDMSRMYVAASEKE